LDFSTTAGTSLWLSSGQRKPEFLIIPVRTDVFPSHGSASQSLGPIKSVFGIREFGSNPVFR
jgi:hypothetical protein